MEKKYVCACGLTCCDCLFYRPDFFEAARKMKEIINEFRIDIFFKLLNRRETNERIAEHLNQDKEVFLKKFASFEKMEQFVEVLNAIVEIQCKQTCFENKGCSIGGIKHRCKTIECVNEKGLNGCWECGENERCEKLSFQKMSYGKSVIENLEILRTKGLGCIKSRGNQYYEFQRKIIKND